MNHTIAGRPRVADKLKTWLESWKLAIAVAGLVLTSLTLAYKSIAANAIDAAKLDHTVEEVKSIKASAAATNAAVSALAIETAKVSVLLAELKQDLREMRKGKQP